MLKQNRPTLGDFRRQVLNNGIHAGGSGTVCAASIHSLQRSQGDGNKIKNVLDRFPQTTYLTANYLGPSQFGKPLLILKVNFHRFKGDALAAFSKKKSFDYHGPGVGIKERGRRRE